LGQCHVQGKLKQRKGMLSNDRSASKQKLAWDRQ